MQQMLNAAPIRARACVSADGGFPARQALTFFELSG
jgi:hypothetical protein